MKFVPTIFFYFPVHFLLKAIGLALLAGAVWSYFRGARPYSFARHLVLVPAAVGVLLSLVEWKFTKSGFLLPAALPLQTVTAAFLIWNLIRIRNSLVCAVLALIAAAGVVSLNLHFLGVEQILLYSLATLAPLLGGCVALPIMVIRIATAGGFSWPLALSAAVIGLVLASVVLSIGLGRFFGYQPVFVLGFAYNGLGALSLIALAGWDAWARAVATGRISQGL